VAKADLIYWTFLTGVISALATGLGAILVAFVHNKSKVVRAFSGAVAAGMMISASVFSLAQEGIALKVKRPLAPTKSSPAYCWERYFSGMSIGFLKTANST